ncbi:MAG: hypothetical protein ACPLXM_05080 [Bacteroidales bacterium]
MKEEAATLLIKRKHCAVTANVNIPGITVFMLFLCIKAMQNDVQN